MTDYFLQVDLLVKKSDKDAFETAMAEFFQKGGFARIDGTSKKELVLALRSEDAFGYDGFTKYEPALKTPANLKVDGRAGITTLDPGNAAAAISQGVEHFRYVHLWRIRDLNELDLVRLMTLSGDDNLYLKVDSLVVREVQNFVTRVTLPNHTGDIPQQQNVTIVRITRYIPTRDLGDFVFSFGGFLPILEDKDLGLLGTFQNVTGTLNIVTEFWRVNADPNVQLVKLAPLLQSTTDIVRDLHKRQRLPGPMPNPSSSRANTVSHVHEQFSPYIALST